MSTLNVSEILAVTLKSGLEVYAPVSAKLVTDNNYGADADGNRGVSMSWVDDVEVTGNLYTDDGLPLSDEETLEALHLLLEMGENYDWDTN